MSNYENAIEIKGLTKKYDGFTLDDITFDVPKGSVMPEGGRAIFYATKIPCQT